MPHKIRERPTRLLIVEDDTDGLELLTVYLGGLGIEVVSASSAQEAIRLAKSHQVDAVLTDLRLPDLSGGELVDELRLERPELEVVFMSGFSRHDRRVKAALQRPRTRFLQKPFDIEQISAALGELGKHR